MLCILREDMGRIAKNCTQGKVQLLCRYSEVEVKVVIQRNTSWRTRSIKKITVVWSEL